jgi:hypothetical protein
MGRQHVVMNVAVLLTLWTQGGEAFSPTRTARTLISTRHAPAKSQVLVFQSIGDDEKDMDQWDDKMEKKERSGFFGPVLDFLLSDSTKEDVKTYTTSLVVAILIRFLVLEPRYIPSLSMFPTFDVGDQLAVEKITKRIRPFSRNEVVVFNPPQSFRDIMEGQFGSASSGRSVEALIKRIVAVEVRDSLP